MDVFEPGPGEQLHDLNPTFAPPTGLFWTIEVPPDAIDVDMAGGAATLQATNLPILDFGAVDNHFYYTMKYIEGVTLDGVVITGNSSGSEGGGIGVAWNGRAAVFPGSYQRALSGWPSMRWPNSFHVNMLVRAWSGCTYR